jgi:hypothetical protein
MSRTYRRKKGREWYWLYQDYVLDLSEVDLSQVELVSYPKWGGRGYQILFKPDSIEGKKRKNEYHSDRAERSKEPGPSWFRNMLVERPQRRDAKNQLRKFMLDSEYEVILNAQDKLEYWT